MLYVHRWASILAGVLVLYIAITGMTMQSMDLFSQVTHQPITSDRTLQEFRQHLNGTDNYAVLSAPDYSAASLPARFDTDGALARVVDAAHKAAPGEPMRLIELRMTHDHVSARVKMGENSYFLFDAPSGGRLPDAWLPPANPNEIQKGFRSETKNWHKFAFNDFLLQKASTLNLLAGIGVMTLVVTGLTHYYRLWRGRKNLGKPEVIWSTRGVWRKFHRWLALIFGAFIIYIVTTGSLLAISDIGAAYAEWKSPRTSRPINPDSGDFSSPLKDTEIPAMTHATLAAFTASHPGVPIRVLQLRHFVNYSQGAVVTGERLPVQHVYNTLTGKEMSETEPGYPVTNFPFGWQWHQTVKRLHRGDFFGLGGNWIEWVTGAGLIYFAGSGLWMYYEMWRRRANAGKRQLVWR